MSAFSDFRDSVFQDINLEDRVGNTKYKYTTPKKWKTMISDMVAHLNDSGYVATSSGDEISIDWAALAAKRAEEEKQNAQDGND